MKKKLTIILVTFIMLLILAIFLGNVSNAAVEVKPGTTSHETNASAAYQYCYDMRSSTSSLGNNSLDPHLTLNADWGAVAYLGASVYGNVRSSSGTSVTIGEKKYNSTTKNITGVMNMGSKATYTAYIHYGSANLEYGANLVNNKDTKYVEYFKNEYFTVEDTKGKAILEVKGWYSNYYATSLSGGKIIRRNGLFCSSQQPFNSTYTTYRPVIWN